MSIPTTLDRDHATRLFLDTEWADDDGMALVSIAIVGNGATEFYAECDPLPRGNTFAREVLYPRLLGGAFALHVPCIARAMADFIAQQHTPHIVATHANDFALLNGLLICAPTMAKYTAELRYSESLRECIRLEFHRDPSRLEQRHNARVDARVLRDAYAIWSTNWGGL